MKSILDYLNLSYSNFEGEKAYAGDKIHFGDPDKVYTILEINDEYIELKFPYLETTGKYHINTGGINKHFKILR